jgi:2-keto-4-pentenoate hydratase/2-oxohepta-3-ene-1,7-dioic acid hydratase in catechol pathway
MKIARIASGLDARLALIVESSAGVAALDLVDAGERLGLSLRRELRSMRDFIAAGDAARDAALELAERARPRLQPIPAERVRWLPPVDGPVSFVCAGRNFGRHLEESRAVWARRGVQVEAVAFPTGFAKLPSALVGHMAEVRIPDGVTELDYEVEVAAVLGPTPPANGDPLARVFGYAVFNDLADRRMQRAEMQNQMLLTAKNHPGMGPLGPWITTSDEVRDPAALAMQLRVNGEIRQDGSTADMLFSFRDLIDFWSRLELKPGDVIASGTPEGVATGRSDPDAFFLRAGDRIDASVSGLGMLTTLIV